ncbi:VRR-NUC domain-containing protein [Sulfitobacter sp.]|uniref:VRR-NUC domain-containing protein n=1 Tax=Sulfitobacter sp. TaxID=1903071 RepID=UPI0030030A57
MIEIPNPLILHRDATKNSKLWVSPSINEPVTVEEAVAGWFRKQGYYASGGYGYLLNALLVSLMFDNFRYHNAEDRTVYKQVVPSGLMTYEWIRMMAERRNQRSDQHTNSWELDIAKDHEARISNAPYRSQEAVESNLKKILPRILRTRFANQKPYSGHEENILGPKHSEASQLGCALALLSALGPDGVIKLSRFRASKFRYRALTSWPDLLIWNRENCSFQEVKSPNDRPSDYQLETLAGIEKMGIPCGILSVASSEEPLAFFKPQIEVDEPTASVAFDNASLNQNNLTLSRSFDELLTLIGGMYLLIKQTCEVERIFLPEDLTCFLTGADGCRYPYDPDTKPTSFFSNGHSDANNSLLDSVENINASYYHAIVKMINRRKIFIFEYLSQISLFEMSQRESYWNLPRVRLRETANKPKFDLSIDSHSIGALITKPFFMKKVIPTLEYLSKAFPLSEGASEQQFLSWYLFSGNGPSLLEYSPIRARNLQEAVFKYALFYRSLPPGPMILESDQKFPGKNRLHDKRFKLPITEDFIQAVRHTKILFEDMGTIKLRTVPLGYSF